MLELWLKHSSLYTKKDLCLSKPGVALSDLQGCRFTEWEVETRSLNDMNNFSVSGSLGSEVQGCSARLEGYRNLFMEI